MEKLSIDRKVRLDDKFKIYYDDGPCDIYQKCCCKHNKRTSFKKKRLSADYVDQFV